MEKKMKKEEDAEGKEDKGGKVRKKEEEDGKGE